MACNRNFNFNSAAAEGDVSVRRSKRSIKPRKFYDEEVASVVVSTGSQTQHLQTQTLSVTSTNSDSNNHEVKEKNKPSTSAIKRQKISSGRTANVLNPFTGIVSATAVSSSNKNKSKRRKPTKPNKNLGCWKPTDDLMLILNTLQTNDLSMVYHGVKFSCHFTLKQIEQRWQALMYDEVISKIAKRAIQKLHLETIAGIESKVLFSLNEEALLGTVHSNSKPTIDIFQVMLDENPNIFYRRRTAKSLMHHWQLMKHYSSLIDQCSVRESPIPIPILNHLEERNTHILNNEQEITTITRQHIPTLEECEMLLNDEQLMNEKEIDPLIERHLHLSHKKINRQVKVLEEEIPRSQVLAFPTCGINPLEFESQTLAILRGQLVRYLMRSVEITIGRSSKYQKVDVDLTMEGPTYKISRLQATIRLHNTGEFFIVCEGKRCLYVNGTPVESGDHIRLTHNCVIEVADLRFIFLINRQLVLTILQKNAKQNPVTKQQPTCTITKPDSSC